VSGTYHVPVLAREVVAGLVVDRDGAYLDATAGGGGHSAAVLAALGPTGRLIAADRDPEAVAETRQRLSPWGGQVTVIQGDFATLRDTVAAAGVTAVNGVLFDLGVSSHQLDTPTRGFGFREEGPLDMRMDPEAGEPAAALVARLAEADLTRILYDFGEERQARRIARAICRQRQEHPLATTADLRRAVERTHPERPTKTLARVFQALRIAVNGELAQLEQGLRAAASLLLPGGRLAVIAYHSLEDRLVKQTMGPLLLGCICPPAMPVCACGRQPAFRRVQVRARRADAAEIGANRRSRSASLRFYERV
jgi:16S rRNA (cytosine1402-N4)-methyltransferase